MRIKKAKITKRKPNDIEEAIIEAGAPKASPEVVEALKKAMKDFTIELDPEVKEQLAKEGISPEEFIEALRKGDDISDVREL